MAGLRFLRQLDLRRDQRDPDSLHAAVEAGVQASGTNMWVLIFAIFVASIGLNVNSTAVIIGAMLISPLMGPIVAIGYGAAVNDFGLIKQAFRTLALFVGISLATATLYFAISPLSQAQSELLARTSPSLWDVLIAFFGGAAGIVALSRREPSNVVPGVAIATALMPPLCTAGYGLATRNLAYFAGAMFLLVINAVFIAYATLLIAKVMRIPARAEVDPSLRKRTRLIIGATVMATLLPSAYLAYELVQQEFFAAAADRVVRELAEDQQFVLLASDVQARQRRLIITLGGAAPPPELGDQLAARLSGPTSGQASVSVRFAGGDRIDVASIKRDLQRDLFQSSTQQLEQQVRQLQIESAAARAAEAARAQLLAELHVEFPEARTVSVAQGEQRTPGDSASRLVLVVHMEVTRAVTAVDERRLRARLGARFAPSQVDLVLTRTP